MIYMKCLFVNNLYCYFYSIFKKYEVLNVKFRVPKYFVLIINNLFKSFYKVIYIYIYIYERYRILMEFGYSMLFSDPKYSNPVQI